MWHHNIGPSKGLETLGQIATRLVRILVYQKLLRGETQLRAEGLDFSFKDSFNAQAVKTVRVSKRRTRKPSVTFIQRGDF